MTVGICRSVRLLILGTTCSLLSLHAAAQGNKVIAISEPPPPARRAKQVFPPRENTTSEKPEVMPVFRGRLKEFYAKNLKYPGEAVRKRWQGETLVAFVIEGTGLITDVRIARSSGYPLLDEEALRVIGLMQHTPYWKPGMHMGVPVAVYYTLAVKFRPDQNP